MAIGIDWGGTRIKGAKVDRAHVIAHRAVDTPSSGDAMSMLDAIATLVRDLDDGEDAVGVAIPGEVRDDGRCWCLPNVPGFEDVEIARELEARLGRRICTENDAIAAAHAERAYGWGREIGSFALVTLGTGIGGGIVIDGRVRRGTGGFAGEIGHVLVDSAPDAWVCGCGRRGCMESYAGTQGLLRCFAQHGGSARSIQDIADATGEASDAVFRQLGRTLGTGLAIVNNVLDLDAFVFSGGISNSFARFEAELRRAFSQRAFAPPLADVALELSRLGEHAGVIGAASLVDAEPIGDQVPRT